MCGKGKVGGITPPLVRLTVNHTFLGGNNPRTELEELEGLQGDTYKIRNRSNSAYGIREEDLPLLTGVYTTDTTIDINYDSKIPSQPTEIFLEPETTRLQVGDNAVLGYRFNPSGDYKKKVTFEMVENPQVANINGSTISGREIGFGMVKVTAVGDGWELSAQGPVIVSGYGEEDEDVS